jgi:hypothetical protein
MNKRTDLGPNAVYIVLMLATLLSFGLAEKSAAAHIATSAAVVIGAFKARCIFVDFMELTWEAKGFRIAFEVWAVLAVVVILGGYWSTIVHPH